MPACRPLILKLKGRILQLAIQKFSSNVVEKCIAVTDPQLRQQLIDELVADRNSMHVLMESQYGMFVIQKALPHAVPRQLQDMKAGIQKHVGGLHNRKMRSKWEKLLAQLVAMTEMPTGHTAAIPRMDELSFAAAGFSREAVPHAAPGKMAFAAPGVPLTSPLMRWPAPERA